MDAKRRRGAGTTYVKTLLTDTVPFTGADRALAPAVDRIRIVKVQFAFD